MAVFIGTFENKIDRKGRVSVPAPFRQALAGQAFQGIVLFPSRRAAALEGCGMDLMEQLIASQSEDDLLNDGPDAPAANIFYDLQQIPFDGDGRISLPAALREQAQIEDSVVFVGVGKRFQLWSAAGLAAYRAQQKQGGGS